MDIRLIALAMLCALWVASAVAQNSPTPAEKSAMERAQREADGPRRRILEAAKVKGTVKAADTTNAAPAAAAPPAVVVAPPVPTVVAKPAVKEEPAPERLLVTQPAVAPVAMPASGVASVPTVSQVELAPASVSMVALPSPSPVTLAPPQLLSKVEPDLPTRLLRRIGNRRTEVLIDLTIQPDGSVSAVAVRPPVDDDLAAPVRDAVSQWRYEPQPVARPHSVRLVFGQS